MPTDREEDVALRETVKLPSVVRPYPGPLALPSRNILFPPLVPPLLSTLINEGIVVVDRNMFSNCKTEDQPKDKNVEKE